MPGPDGVLSWFMAALCFIVTMLFMCIFRTASLLYTSFMTTFQVSRGEASLPICIFVGFTNLSGTGQGILFSCTIVCINEYFDKRRGFALGLNLAGATMASFVFPKILEFVLLEYGLKGALLLLGGMLLNIPAISFLFRPPPWIKNENKTVVEVTDSSEDPYDVLGKMSIVCTMNADQDKLYLKIEPSNAGRRGTLITLGDREAVRRGRVISFGEGPHRISTEADTSHTEQGSLHSRRGTIISSTETDTVFRSVAPSPADVQNQNMSRRGTLLSVAGSLARESVLGFVDAQPTRRGTVISMGNRCQIELSTVPKEPLKIPLHSIQAARPRTAMDSVRDVLLMPRFYFYTMSYFSFSFFLDGFLTIVVDYGVDIGLDMADAVYVLTFFSATDTIGRIFVPILTDCKVFTNTGLMTVCYFVMAFLAQAIPFAQTKVTFWVVTISLGVPIGYLMVGISDVLATEVGMRNLPIAYGILASVTAIGSFSIPVVISFFRDTYGSYDGLMRFMGGMILMSFLFTAGLWLSDPIKKRKPKLDTAGTAVDNNNVSQAVKM
ncbi:uncharacterized protein ISCGN_008781 [Ixodes scapularis]